LHVEDEIFYEAHVFAITAPVRPGGGLKVKGTHDVWPSYPFLEQPCPPHLKNACQTRTLIPTVNAFDYFCSQVTELKGPIHMIDHQKHCRDKVRCRVLLRPNHDNGAFKKMPQLEPLNQHMYVCECYSIQPLQSTP
jgi:hypothetical protein